MSGPPLIGLNGTIRELVPGSEWAAVPWPYVQALTQAGGVPLIIPPAPDPEALFLVLDRLDGLVLTGGYDLPPEWYGQEAHPRTQVADRRRLAGDRLLVDMALDRALPILAICLGCQLLNVALGGDLIQDIPSQVATEIVHAVPQPRPQDAANSSQGNTVAEKRPLETFHPVRVQAGSRLSDILGHGTLEVNSSHHQALNRLGKGLQAVAWAPDGIVEGVEVPGRRFLLGVQWHPERIADRPEHLALFQALVQAT